MDSHILVPKVILKQFVNENQNFYKYEIEHKRISLGYPKSTFTQKDYYSKTMEEMLNKNIESKLIELVAYANSLHEEHEIFKISTEMLDLAKLYFRSLIARSPDICSGINEHSVFFQLLRKQDQHDYAVDSAMTNKIMDDLVEKYNFSFILNKTSIPYVLPIRGLYDYSINGVSCINIPLNSHSAIFLTQKGKCIHSDANYAYMYVNEKPHIHLMNKSAMVKQINCGWGYVVCRDKPILENLLKNL